MPTSPAMLPTLMMLPLPLAAIFGASAAVRKYGAWTLAVKSTAEGRRVEVRRRPEPGVPGVVDQHVDRRGLPGQFVQLGRVAEVGGDEPGLAALGGDGVDHRLAAAGVAPVHDDLGAVPRQLLGRRLADAGGRAGDQRAQAFKVSLLVSCAHHVRSPAPGWGIRHMTALRAARG